MFRHLTTLLFVFLILLLGAVSGCRTEPVFESPPLSPPPTVAVPTAAAVVPTATLAATATPEASPTLAATAPSEATATVAAEPSPTATVDEPTAAAPTTVAPTPTLEPVEGAPSEIARDFLNEVMAEADETELARYLDAGLRAQLAEEGINELLGISQRYRSFAITLLDDGSRDGEAAVRAALSYAEPVYLRFLLTLDDNGSWYISAVEPQEAPEVADDPGEVVNEFLTSLLYDRTGSSALPYLTSNLQQEVAAGRTVFDLLGVDRVYSTFAYTVLDDGSRSGTATVETILSYPAGPVTATFTLVETAEGWRISQMSSG